MDEMKERKRRMRDKDPSPAFPCSLLPEPNPDRDLPSRVNLSKSEQVFELKKKKKLPTNGIAGTFPASRQEKERSHYQVLTPMIQSDARVILERYLAFIIAIFRVAEPFVPVVAHALSFLQPLRRELLLRRILALKNLQSQTGRRMPGDVAMHQPHSWVIGFEGDDDETALGEQDYVSARRISFFEIYKFAGKILTGLL